MIYFDNNATTSIDPAVLEAMLPFLKEQYGNPSSAYSFGKRVAGAVEHAREQVATLLACEPSEILFTSCGTESDNTALQSALSIDQDRKHIITSKVEHSAIVKHAEALARRGYEVTWLDVDAKGMIDLSQLEAAIRPDTAIVSLMWANNETGVLFRSISVQLLSSSSRCPDTSCMRRKELEHYTSIGVPAFSRFLSAEARRKSAEGEPKTLLPLWRWGKPRSSQGHTFRRKIDSYASFETLSSNKLWSESRE